MASSNFQAYDYGDLQKNTQVYGHWSPTVYNLKDVPADIPMLVMYGGADQLATTMDVETFLAQLPTDASGTYPPPQVTTSLLPKYAHADFIFSKKLGTDVTQKIIDFLSDHPN